jgi:nucleoside-diphosphate-sugar epimerase
MGRAFVLGATGQIGRVVCRRLLEAGWDVTGASRGSQPTVPGVERAVLDRDTEGALARAVAGFDLVVDVVCFTAAHARQLQSLDVGSVVAISSASVYCDDQGRTLDEASDEASFPRLPVPVPESQRTVEPGEATYSTQKVAMELALLSGSIPATVIRPCAIHGPGSSLPRELYFVKRVLDGRDAVVLVSNGDSRFHTTSVANLAELVALAAGRPEMRVLNCGDPGPPTVAEIGRAVCAALGRNLEQVLLPESGYARPELSNPWAALHPFIVDMAAAESQLGYRPVTTYPEAVRETVAWLAEEAPERDWSETYLGRYFDYAAEDAVLSAR